MEVIKVVCGIIYHQESIFIARRKEGKSMAGKWEFPGGKIHDGESQKEALKRELFEELGMEVIVGEKIGSNIHHYESYSINLIAYRCKFVSATFAMTDHDQYKWVTRKILGEFNFTDADIPLIDLINSI
jgi:8-oxo-dGTP diphosphatase